MAMHKFDLYGVTEIPMRKLLSRVQEHDSLCLEACGGVDDFSVLQELPPLNELQIHSCFSLVSLDFLSGPRPTKIVLGRCRALMNISFPREFNEILEFIITDATSLVSIEGMIAIPNLKSLKLLCIFGMPTNWIPLNSIKVLNNLHELEDVNLSGCLAKMVNSFDFSKLAKLNNLVLPQAIPGLWNDYPSHWK